MHNFIYTRYKKERNYKEYDDIISIRLNTKFYKFLYKINPNNISSTIRFLIRADLYEGNIEVTHKDENKMFSCFRENDRKRIEEYTYTAKKGKSIQIRLYKNEKKTIINRSGGNISNYVDLVIMDFINKISENYRRWK